MAKFQGGFTFTETGAGASVTAATLNALINSAEALPGIITEQTAETTPADDDVFLMYDTSAGELRKITKGNFVGTPVGLVGTRGLSALSTTTTVAITADEAVLRQSGGSNAKLHQSISLTCTLGTYSGGSTANGRDHATVAASGWLYLYLISNGTTIASLLSDSATAPVLPTGYTYAALIGAIYQSGSSMRVTHITDGRKHSIPPQSGSVVTNATVNNSPTSATGYTAAAFTTFVPSIAKRMRGFVASAGGSPGRVIVAATTAGLGAVALWADVAGASGAAADLDGAYSTSQNFEVPIVTAQTLYWKHSVNHSRLFYLNGYDL